MTLQETIEKHKKISENWNRRLNNKRNKLKRSTDEEEKLKLRKAIERCKHVVETNTNLVRNLERGLPSYKGYISRGDIIYFIEGNKVVRGTVKDITYITNNKIEVSQDKAYTSKDQLIKSL